MDINYTATYTTPTQLEEGVHGLLFFFPILISSPAASRGRVRSIVRNSIITYACQRLILRTATGIYRCFIRAGFRAVDVNNLHGSAREPSRTEEFETADVGHRRWKTIARTAWCSKLEWRLFTLGALEPVSVTPRKLPTTSRRFPFGQRSVRFSVDPFTKTGQVDLGYRKISTWALQSVSLIVHRRDHWVLRTIQGLCF